MHSIFNDDIESTVKDNSLAFVNNQFELSIKMTIPDVQSMNQDDLMNNAS